MTKHDDYAEVRARLLSLMQKDGILYASTDQRILSMDGREGRWMLNSLAVSLSPEGMALAGRCMLHLLERFSGCTIATLGTTAIPLLSSMVLQSDGRVNGLLVRKERKPYGSMKLIEGKLDKTKPVIVVDDSISSGRAMLECIEKLEQEGFRVEGGLVLVHFGFHTGFGRVKGKGYHVEAVFDIYSDFMHYMDHEPDIVPNPTKKFPALRRSNQKLADGLHPAICARQMMRTYLETGKLPLAPSSLDGDYDSRGGVWVSIRNTAFIHDRHAREGFWHFPGETPGTALEDLELACLKTAAKLPKGREGLAVLEKSAVAVTFFGPLEACNVGNLDNDRYGIVVCSDERPGIMGGALPRMPNLANTWHQFQHARLKNAKLFRHEPYRIYRHDLTKHIEPGQDWQPTGVPLPGGPDPRDLPEQTVAARVLDVLASLVHGREEQTEPLPADLVSAELIFVSIYSNGTLIGCMGGAVQDLDKDLKTVCRNSLNDARFSAHRARGLESLAVAVSFLDRGITMGTMAPDRALEWFTYGHESLQVSQKETNRMGLFLSSVPCYLNLTPKQFVRELVDKAGITRKPYTWRKYRTRSWLASPGAAPRA